MSSDEGDAAALRAQLTAMTAERDAALARAEAAEAEAAAALQRVASLEQLLARGSDSGDAAADELLLLDDSDADAAEADTAVAGPPLNPPARRPGDLERQYGDAAAEPPASQAVNPFARAFDPAQEVRARRRSPPLRQPPLHQGCEELTTLDAASGSGAVRRRTGGAGAARSQRRRRRRCS
jgi:hypothetical protein